jgi:hypothetical protein
MDRRHPAGGGHHRAARQHEICLSPRPIVVLEEELAKHGVTFPAPASTEGRTRKDDPNRAYKVLICDYVGLKFGKDGKPDHSAVKAHIEDVRRRVPRPGRPMRSTLEPGKDPFLLPA